MAIKFQVGETKALTFKYNTPKEVDGTYGKQFMYGVTVNGVDDYYYATPTAHKILQENGLKVGDTVAISKVTDKQMVYMRNNVVLMPKEQGAPNTQAPSNTLERRVELIENELKTLKAMVSGLTFQAPKKEELSKEDMEQIDRAFGGAPVPDSN